MILSILSIIALVRAATYSVKARREPDAEQKADYRKRASLWGIVFLAIIVTSVLFSALRGIATQ